LPADFAFAAADAGVKTVAVTFKRAGVGSLTVTDTASAATQGAATVTVAAGAASACAVSQEPASSVAGSAFGLAVTVQDAFGNVATGYSGTVHLTSSDGHAILPADTTFVPATDAGDHAFSAVLITTGAQTITISDVANPALHCSAAVAVTPGPAIALQVTPASATPTAGQPVNVTITAVDLSGGTATGYRGTVHLTSSDASATLPADFAFAAADAGVKTVAVTFKRAGAGSLTVTDTASAATQGAASVTVVAGAASACAVSQEPASSVAGSAFGLAVTVQDAFGNLASGYSGTVHVASSDGRAILPADTTFVPATDAGDHAFSAALITTGAQTITISDVANPALQCSASVTVTPAALKVVLGLPPNVNAGFPVIFQVAVKDVFDNAIPNYVGTVTFTSTDTGAGAVTPPPLIFLGTEGGVSSINAAFVTLGPQTLSASDNGAPAATGAASSNVHGLVYTGPTSGRVRLVANSAQSNTQVVQLDLVANERLEISSFFGGGPGSFTAGMNLPIDTTRVGADNTFFIRGNALPAGTGTPVTAAAIGPTDHVLYTVVSRKRVTGTAVFAQVTEVQPGQVFYSVRLRLAGSATPGVVFNGNQPSPLFRASVIDQFGNDFVIQSDFGVGRLDVL
jgi:hypothetical protein